MANSALWLPECGSSACWADSSYKAASRMSRFSPQSRTRSSASGSSRSDLERKLAVGNPSLKWTMDESNICDTNPLGVCESIGSKRNIRQALP